MYFSDDERDGWDEVEDEIKRQGELLPPPDNEPQEGDEHK